MSEPEDLSAMKSAFGDVAPKLVALTEEVLFGDVWKRADLSPRDRSLVTVAVLVAGGHTEQLAFHLDLAKRNGLSRTEIVEVITHLAFYAGWPRAMTAISLTSRAFEN